MGFHLGQNLIIAVVVAWTLLWKCYSVWLAVENKHKKWFVVLVILNTLGILDMIYVFGVLKKKQPEVTQAFNSIFSKNSKQEEEKK
ncbi:MAG: DUF5652 family protein [Patescibacteria group bacterium]